MGVRVSILGAGNGGCATAAHLALRGVACTLFDLPAFEGGLAPIRAAGAIRLSGVLGDTTVPAPLLTTDVRGSRAWRGRARGGRPRLRAGAVRARGRAVRWPVAR